MGFKTMKRRDFVTTALGGMVMPSLARGVFKKTTPSVATAKTTKALLPPSDNILVVIQLEGGNDALNMLVPVDQYATLKTLRPNILAAESALLPLSGQPNLKLHPSMTGLQALHNEGKVKFIQSVGYDNHSRSHALATAGVLSGLPSPTGNTPTGWLGRYLSYFYPTYPNLNNFPANLPTDPLAIEFGDYNSFLLQDTGKTNAINLGSPYAFLNLYWAYKGNNLKTDTVCAIDEPIPNYTEGGAVSRLKHLRLTNQLNMHYLNRLYKVYDKPDNLAYISCLPYGCTGIASLTQQMKMIAFLINGGLNTPIFVVRQQGYDTHANQNYNQGVALKDLSDAIKTFQDTLNAPQRKRVIGLVCTEFGRTIKGNGDGTDHATAHSTFLFGDSIHCPTLGSNPTIPNAAVFNNPAQWATANNLSQQFAYRDIYAALLRQWLCITSEDTKAILQGDYNTLPIIKNPSCTNIMTPRIVGATKVCPDGTIGYTTQSPTQAPVSYTWSVVNGQIVSGQGTNAVFVKWGTNGEGALKVEVTLK